MLCGNTHKFLYIYDKSSKKYTEITSNIRKESTTHINTPNQNLCKNSDKTLINNKYLCNKKLIDKWSILTSNSLFVNLKKDGGESKPNKWAETDKNIKVWLQKYPITQGFLFLCTNIIYPTNSKSRLYINLDDYKYLKKTTCMMKLWENIDVFASMKIEKYYDETGFKDMCRHAFKKIYETVLSYINNGTINNDQQMLTVFWKLCCNYMSSPVSTNVDEEHFELYTYDFKNFKVQNFQNFKDNETKRLPEILQKLYRVDDVGWIGQLIRICVCRDTSIKGNVLILIRDGHATCPTINGIELLNRFIETNQKIMLSHNEPYNCNWHRNDLFGYNKGIWMGYTTIKIKDSVNPLMMHHGLCKNDNLWFISWGKAFTIIKDDQRVNLDPRFIAHDDIPDNQDSTTSNNKYCYYVHSVFDRMIHFAHCKKYNIKTREVNKNPFIYGLDEYLASYLLYTNFIKPITQGSYNEDYILNTHVYSAADYSKVINKIKDDKIIFWHNFSLLFFIIKHLYMYYPTIYIALQFINEECKLDEVNVGHFFSKLERNMTVHQFLQTFKRKIDQSKTFSEITLKKLEYCLNILPKKENIFYTNCFNQFNDEYCIIKLGDILKYNIPDTHLSFETKYIHIKPLYVLNNSGEELDEISQFKKKIYYEWSKELFNNNNVYDHFNKPYNPNKIYAGGGNDYDCIYKKFVAEKIKQNLIDLNIIKSFFSKKVHYKTASISCSPRYTHIESLIKDKIIEKDYINIIEHNKNSPYFNDIDMLIQLNPVVHLKKSAMKVLPIIQRKYNACACAGGDRRNVIVRNLRKKGVYLNTSKRRSKHTRKRRNSYIDSTTRKRRKSKRRKSKRKKRRKSKRKKRRKSKRKKRRNQKKKI